MASIKDVACGLMTGMASLILLTGCAGGDKGTLSVEGAGVDTFEVFDARGQSEVSAGTSGSEVQLQPGRYVLFVNGAGARILVRGGRRLVVRLATLSVEGLGVDTYEIRDGSGDRSLLSRNVGTLTELLPGDYQVKLNGIRQVIDARAGAQIKLVTGSLRVADGGPPLVTVYDHDGRRLGFRGAGKPIELLPGNYIADYAGDKRPIEIKAGEQLELTP